MIQNDPVSEKTNRDKDPVYETCRGDSEPGAWPRGTLKKVVLRYEVQENGQTRHRTVVVDPQQCEGVLWTENAARDVTRFRFFSRLRRLCWKLGSGRPAWLTVSESQPVSAAAGADQEGTDPPGQPKMMMMMSASVTAEHSGEVEVDADSGNCYYYNGQIICC
jgi:hypothetical protein